MKISMYMPPAGEEAGKVDEYVVKNSRPANINEALLPGKEDDHEQDGEEMEL